MVARSNNETRLEKMKKRNACVEDLKVLAINRLQNQFDRDNPQYQQTLKNLIIQVSNARNQLMYVCLSIGNDQAIGRRAGDQGTRG